MGYDMRWREPDSTNVEAVAAADEAFHVACRERDALPRDSVEAKAAQVLVEQAFDELRRAETDYFRLNVWGMSRWCEAMRYLGMLCQPERQPWPEIESYGVTWADVEAVDDPDYAQPRSAELHERAQRYVAARDAYLADHGGECPGIPEHKFGSNDGWIVTPAECQAALRIVSDLPAEQVQEVLADTNCEVDYWTRWVRFIAGAVTHGGFEVN